MMVRKNNMAASVRQRLLNRAREQREDFNLLLTRYATKPAITASKSHLI